jgi:hypothetical protein
MILYKLKDLKKGKKYLKKITKAIRFVNPQLISMVSRNSI